MNDKSRDFSIPDGTTIFIEQQQTTVLASRPEEGTATKIAGPRDAKKKKKKN
ncbi:MAG: hypothetical protein AABO58_23925 [Acidobacteriota bacterium]